MDELGFGLDRPELMGWAVTMTKAKGFTDVTCGNRWFSRFMRIAKQRYPDFCESRRSSIERKRAEKHKPAVFDHFFGKVVKKVYAKMHAEGTLATPEPRADQVYNVDEMHSNPEKKRSKKLGRAGRASKSQITFMAGGTSRSMSRR